MKSLDEVIKAYELCHASVLSCEGCPYDNGERWRDSDCYLTDALQWLNGYKVHIELDKLRDKCEAENEPLSWEELKQMEGKPVWIEESADNGLWWTYWGIWQHENAVLPEKTYGTTWRAYRKKRE